MGVEGVASDTVGIRPTRHRAGAAKFRSGAGKIEDRAQRLVGRLTPNSAANPEINWQFKRCGRQAIDCTGLIRAIRRGPTLLVHTSESGGGVYATVNTI